MPNRILLFMASAAIASTSPSSLNARQTAGQPDAHGGHKTAVVIPASVQREHKQIHEALTAATKAPGRVGAAARELAAVLAPHFEREEQIALPPLGLLAPLAAGERPPDMASVLAMTDALRKELPRMLEEHPRIHAAVAKLGIVAREEHASEHADLADDLTAHARSEEEVLYPATILVGDLIRVWMAGKPRQICGARSAALRDATLAHIVEPLNVPPQWRFILERSDETRARPYDPWTSAQRRRDL